MSQDYHAHPYDSPYNDEVNGVGYRYINNTIPANRNIPLFYPDIGTEVPDKTDAFQAWPSHEQYQYNHMLQYCTPYHQLIPLPRPLNLHEELAQLVPDDPRIVIQILPIVSDRPTAMPSGDSISPTNIFVDANSSTPALNHHPFEGPFNATYQDGGGIFLPRIDTTSSTAFTPPVAASLPPSPSTASVTASQNSPTSEYFESEPAIDSLPLLKLSYGAWKCMLCGQELRRKQRAVVHYWSKHSDVRLSCSGRCGSLDCNKSFASQDGIDVHLNPVLVDCSLCGRSLLKKNILRHRIQHCRPMSSGAFQ